jgi:hypothetical protein
VSLILNETARSYDLLLLRFLLLLLLRSSED